MIDTEIPAPTIPKDGIKRYRAGIVTTKPTSAAYRLYLGRLTPEKKWQKMVCADMNTMPGANAAITARMAAKSSVNTHEYTLVGMVQTTNMHADVRIVAVFKSCTVICADFSLSSRLLIFEN